jgi:DNA end-binding protein Ku
MKASWSGYITLGQIGFPVQLYRGEKPGRLRLSQLYKKDLSPIELVTFSRTEGKPIDKSQVVKGVKQENGGYVVLSEFDLAQASPVGSKAIAITQFSDQAEIDPIYYEKPYYIVPTKGGERAYALIREVLFRTKKAAIARFVLRAKEHIAAIRPYRDILVLQQLRFTGELVPRSDINTPPLEKPSLAELEAGMELVNRMSGPFFAEDYHDEQAEQLKELVERKAKGLPARKKSSEKPPATDDSNLVEDIRKSLKEPPALPG